MEMTFRGHGLLDFGPLLPHFRGLRDGVKYKFLGCIPHRHQLRNRNVDLWWSGFPRKPFSPLMSTVAVRSQHKDAEYRPLVVGMIDSD